MFNDKLASFNAFPSIGDVSLGELTFPHIQLPLKHLDLASAEFKRVYILTDYDFFLPLNSGYGIVTFRLYEEYGSFEKFIIQTTSFDWAGRIIGLSDNDDEKHNVKQGTVSQCGPNEFVVSHGWGDPELIVFDSILKCLRKARCKKFSHICCNSKFVFGLWYNSDCDVLGGVVTSGGEVK